jgi:hypothetical protein
MKTVTLKPRNLIFHAIDFGIVLGALQDGRIFLNRINSFPLARARKRNGISTSSGKCVDQNTTPGGTGFRNMFCNFTIGKASSVERPFDLYWETGNKLCDRFWSNAKPSIVS